MSRSVQFRSMVVVAAIASLAVPAAAQADATFEVSAENMKSMPLTAWGFKVARTGTTNVGGGAGSSLKFDDVWFTKLVDENSPKLFKLTALGTHALNASITVTKAGKQTMKYCFRDVLFTSIDDSGAGAATPTETVKFNSATVTLSYTPYSTLGYALSPIKFGWNAAASLTGDYTC